MKTIRKITGLFLLFTLLIPLLAFPVRGAEADYTFYGSAGSTEYFVITSNAYDQILSAIIDSGSIPPGMELNVAGDVTLGLAGVPSAPGEYSAHIRYTTRDLGEVRILVTVFINPSSTASGTPTVTKNPTGETVVEGDSATFIARADNVKQYIWHIAIADASLTADELESYVGQGLKVSGGNTDTLVLSNIPRTMNDAYIWCQFVGTEESVDSTAAILTVTSAKDATPVVTKNPTDETVDEGGRAVFIAKAKYAQSYIWYFVDPWGGAVPCIDAAHIYQSMKISGHSSEKLVLENVPAELDGYRVYCSFTAGKVVSSEMAYIHVTSTQTPPATETAPEETTQPSDPATEAIATEAPTEEPTVPPTEEVTIPATEEQAPAEEKKSGGNNTLIIVAMICMAVVAVSGIAAYVILKLKAPKEE